MTKPPLVIVSGPPGAGKTRLSRPLAKHLQLPLLAKDTIKEQFADSLGESAFTMSGKLGLAAHIQLVTIASEILRSGHGVVIESFFHKGLAEPDLGPLVDISSAVLIHVKADDAILISRYEQRMKDPDRHPIHNDGNRLGDLRHYLAEGVADRLELDCPHIVIDTTYGPIDAEEVAFMVREKLSLA